MILVNKDEFLVCLHNRRDDVLRTPCKWTFCCPRTIAGDVLQCHECPASGHTTPLSFAAARTWWPEQAEASNNAYDSGTLRDQLKNFIGTANYYKSPNPSVLYTDGVDFIAKEVPAGWLVSDLSLDIVALASYVAGDDKYGLRNTDGVTVGEKDSRLLSMQFWTLTVAEDSSAVLECVADKGEPVAFSQKYEYTDFPVGEWDFWAQYNGTHWVIMLPSEY